MIRVHLAAENRGEPEKLDRTRSTLSPRATWEKAKEREEALEDVAGRCLGWSGKPNERTSNGLRNRRSAWPRDWTAACYLNILCSTHSCPAYLRLYEKVSFLSRRLHNRITDSGDGPRWNRDWTVIRFDASCTTNYHSYHKFPSLVNNPHWREDISMSLPFLRISSWLPSKKLTIRRTPELSKK